MLEQFITQQIVEDHRNSLIEFERDIRTDDIEINKDDFDRSNQILFIKNYSIFLDVFSSVRTSMIPMTFFFKDLNFISIFSKISNNFPFILLRVKENKNVMCKDVDSVYEFPIKDIFKKEITTKKKYDVILESIGYLKYKTISYLDRVASKEYEFKISEGRSKTLLNDVVGIPQLIPFQTYLMEMNICVIKQEQHKENILVLETVDPLTKTFLVVSETSPGSMYLEHEKQFMKEKINISPTQNPIMISKDFKGGRFQFESFQLIYRLPYLKLVNVKSKLYYVLCHSGDDYYFLKVIATTDSLKEGRTIGDVFGSCDSIFEGYRLKQV